MNDVFRNEIDRNWTVLVLHCGSETIYATSPSPEINSGNMESPIGAKVAMIGAANRAEAVAIALRKHLLKM